MLLADTNIWATETQTAKMEYATTSDTDFNTLPLPDTLPFFYILSPVIKILL